MSLVTLTGNQHNVTTTGGIHGAADGFNVMPPVLPAMLEVFIAEVIPLLQRRGLFRTSEGVRQ